MNKRVLQSVYTPETILHRDEQINTIANILAPVLREEKPSNLFVYGKTGTGKTLSIKYTTQQIMTLAAQKELPIKILYLNCKLKKIADTEYRLMAHLAREFGKAIPPTGLPTDEVYRTFFDAVDSSRLSIILVLDEIDQLVRKAGDEILYNLTRINDDLKRSQISIVGISNDLLFADNLDPRIKSSLSEEEIVFPPYNAIQIQHILRRRAKVAFKPDVLQDGTIEKCAAFAARDHGDARRALELLRVSGEIAERTQSDKVLIEHIDQAEQKIERDKVVDIILSQPKQFQAILYSIISVTGVRKEKIFTGDVYEVYKEVCKKTGLRPLTQRRISDCIAEFDMLGIINASVISKGRYGRTREISLAIPAEIVPKAKRLLKNSLDI